MSTEITGTTYTADCPPTGGSIVVTEHGVDGALADSGAGGCSLDVRGNARTRTVASLSLEATDVAALIAALQALPDPSTVTDLPIVVAGVGGVGRIVVSSAADDAFDASGTGAGKLAAYDAGGNRVAIVSLSATSVTALLAALRAV